MLTQSSGHCSLLFAMLWLHLFFTSYFFIAITIRFQLSTYHIVLDTNAWFEFFLLFVLSHFSANVNVQNLRVCKLWESNCREETKNYTNILGKYLCISIHSQVYHIYLSVLWMVFNPSFYQALLNIEYISAFNNT